MTEPQNGFEYLKRMREQAENEDPSFHGFERYLDRKARKAGTPIHGQFELTPLCNFNCGMCYVHLTNEQRMGREILTAEQWIDLMKQACSAGMYDAVLSGGECLSYPGFREVYLYLQSQGCKVSILTNGSLLDEEWICFFKEHPPYNIRITLYGPDEDTYERVTGRRCFQSVCDHIRLIKEAGFSLTLSVTPNIFLGEKVFDTIRTAKSMCDQLMISNALFSPREETGRAGLDADVDLEYYLRIHRLNNMLDGKECSEIPAEQLPECGGPSHECSECGVVCGGGMSGFSIDWKGTMRPCERMQDIEAWPLRDGFAKAWETIHEICSNWPRVPECDGCAYSRTCIICPAYMRVFAEPGKQPLELCRRTKYLVQHGVWRIPDCD